METVITPDFELVGSSVGQLKLFDRHAVNLLAVSRKGGASLIALRSVKLRAGDVIVLRGNLARCPNSRRTALPATRRTRSSHGPARELLPIAILAAAMALVAFNVVPVAVAFFGAAVILLSPARSRCARLMTSSNGRSDHARRADPAQQRLVHHGRHGFDRVSALVRCDFLTPIGHQCNTLVMGPGGYRFGDYWRLGLPLSIIVLIVGVPLIAFFWSI